jgi:PPP family 3-phenylpropionic acid transporter
MYAAYGVASPFLPAFVNERGVPPEQLGLVLAAGTAIRLASAPLAARISCAVTVLADALSLASSSASAFRVQLECAEPRSAAFIAGLLVSGQLVGAYGLAAIIWSQALLLTLATFAAARVPEIARERVDAPPVSALVPLRIPLFRNVVLVAAMILGSHAMHDAFAMIRWSAAGISPGAASVLWSLSVASEVLVFSLIGPPLVARLTPRGAIVLAALAGVLRWGVMAQTPMSLRRAGAAASRPHLRAAPPCLHAAHCAPRAARRGRHRAGRSTPPLESAWRRPCSRPHRGCFTRASDLPAS